MLTLYDYLPSQNAWKVRLLLAQLGLEYETRLIRIFDGEGQADDVLAVSPMGVVPAIVFEDGRALAESNAILTCLATGTAFLPDEAFERSKVFQWLCFENAYVQPSIGLFRYLRLVHGAEGPPPGDLRTNIGYRALDAMEAQLARTEFIAGDRYTVADMSLYAYTHAAQEAGFDIGGLRNFAAWLARVREQPGFGPPVHPYDIDPSSTQPLPSFGPRQGPRA